MNTRKDFIKSIGLFLPAALVVSARPAQSETPGWFEHNGFSVKWTGWKSAYNSADLVAQWVAVSKQPVKIKQCPFWANGFYASNGGGHGHFRRGDCFCIDHFADVPWVDATNVDTVGPAVKAATFKLLMKAISEGLANSPTVGLSTGDEHGRI